ncbi:hypothetical protein EB118_04875 [bacterium]|nr:hypothetical protein [bacterium]NDC94171.1 hypothetical protein [bacterium]NDD82769.1 hypothetical protein [bacterium]NDG29420.1 hypothetical protein [bacterium]
MKLEIEVVIVTMIASITDFDFNKLKIGKSGRLLKLVYDKEPLSFCTEALYMPFSVNSNTKEWSNMTEYSIECSLDQSSSEQSVAFKTFLEKLDETVESLLKAHPDVTTDFTYYKFFKDNGNYPKRMRLQLPRDKYGNFCSFVFDNNKNKIPISEDNLETVLCKGKVFKCIIECAKVYIYNGKAGSIWNITQLKFQQPTSAGEGIDPVYSQIMIN